MESAAAESAVPVPKSFLGWAIDALGIYSVLIPIAALFALAVTIFILIRGKGPFAGAALVLVVPMPMLVGFFAALKGVVASFSILALTEVQVKSNEVAAGVSEALVAPLSGMLLMAPIYILAVVGMVVRSVLPDTNRSDPQK